MPAAALAILAASAFLVPQDGEVTFSRDIAPIIFANCSACHRPGESAPFPLLTYDDVKRRARQIGVVTQSRYMPPWLPDPSVTTFVDERRLSDRAVDLIERWVEQGAPEGDRSDLPPTPTWTDGWQLGEPDLVVEAPEPYTVPADGIDVFRNLVIPIPVDTTKYVRAVELRPGNPAVVHHAIMQIDRTWSSRRADARDEGPGFGGMSMEKSEPPDGTFLGWTPGYVPSFRDDDLAWRLDPGVDMVLQLHMVPIGRPEVIRPKIGFFFADRPPPVRPFVVTLRNDLIDIPAGASSYRVTDSFTLPVAADAHVVYPHAHYLGKDLKGYATLPDGSRRWLVHIPDWDFNWQDEYRFETPVTLPAGSVIAFEYTYDNSAENVRNPSQPPQRVRFGNQSTDEMATLTLQLLTASGDDRATLDDAYDVKSQHALITYSRRLIELDPQDARAYETIGTAERALGNIEAAITAYEEALRLRPAFPDALVNLGSIYGEMGRHGDAVDQFERVLEIEPSNADARNNLGVALEASGRVDDAIAQYEAALALQPDQADAHYNLGTALARRGRGIEAARHLQGAIALKPDHFNAYLNLGVVLMAARQFEDALRVLDRLIRLDPDNVTARINRGKTLLALGRASDAERALNGAVRADPEDAEARANLAYGLRHMGRFDEAARTLVRAIELDPTNVDYQRELAGTLFAMRRFDEAIPVLHQALTQHPENVRCRIMLGVGLGATGRHDEARAEFEEAVRIDPGSSQAHGNLGRVLALAGKPREAIKHYRTALDLNPDDVSALSGLARILATHPDAEIREPDEALRRATRAAEMTGLRSPEILDTLAAAFAASGQFDEAVEAANHAASLADASGNTGLARDIRRRIRLYRSSRPYVENPR
jgi:tetratricopeptide (TPR) repeat protein